jgi:antitoxin (DNA-binding transcriptional repressor) of toxin-antitoxin stability system
MILHSLADDGIMIATFRGKTMSAVPLSEAQSHLSELITRLKPGETIQITSNGNPLARLTREPAAVRHSRKPGTAKGKLVIHADDDEHLRDFSEYMS